MRTFEKPELEPLTQMWCDSTDDALAALATRYAEISAAVHSAPRAGAEHLLSKLESYLQYIYAQDAAAGRTVYLLLKPTDLESLENLPIYAGDWLALEKRGAAAPLRKALHSWAETMRSLTI